MQKLINKQKGAVVILMAFIIGLGATAYLLYALDPARLRVEQDKKTYQTLNEAKQALIAWAVSHQYTPGQMPWPDRNGDGNYDGSSDCMPVAGVFLYPLLLGQLPSLPTTSPCLDPNTGLNIYLGLSTYPGLGNEFRDAQGNKLWYAVSRNLVYDYENAEAPIINPGMINPPHLLINTPYLRQGGTQSYPWIQVLDRNGALISDRVAAVIIAPGDAIGGQNRSAAAPVASEFLDRFVIGATPYSNRTNDDADEDFIMGDDSRYVSNNDPNFVKPYNFNDKLVYITIDELMAALEKRVGEEVRTSLKTYQDTNGYYPYAAQLGTTVMYSGAQNLLSGFLPVNPQNCSYNAISAASRTMSCTQPLFDAATTAVSSITQVRFYLPSGTFTFSIGNCTRQSSNTRCYCTGAGSCSNPAITFSCNSSSCNAVGTGATGDIRIRGGKLTSSAGGCLITTPITRNAATNCPITTTNRITCNSTNGQFSSHANGDVPLDTFLPNWFNQNQWGNYFYYELTRPASATISVGNRTSEVSVISVGRAIDSVPFAASRGAIQVRPSCNAAGLNNYLDSTENVSVNVPNSIYDATSTLRNLNYNDQNFVVAP
jgi:hypothetical protein